MKETHQPPPRQAAASAAGTPRYRCEACDAPSGRDAICEGCGHSVMLDLHNPHDVQYRSAQRAMQQARRGVRLESIVMIGGLLVLLGLIAGTILATGAAKIVLGCVALVAALAWTMRFIP